MSINVYEILNEFSLRTTDQDRKNYILRYNSHPFKTVLKLAFDPNIEFYYKEIPKDYIVPDTLPGIRYSDIINELRRLDLFIKNTQRGNSLTEERRYILFLQLLESLEPEEAKVLINIMNKDLKIPHLTKDFILEVFPNLF